MSDDRIAIVDATTRIAWLAGRREWDRLVEVFTDQVQVDYTSLAGGAPTRLSSADLVAWWRSGLGGLDATQHLVSDHLVDVDGDVAVATAQFIATHVLANSRGDSTWTVGGHYRFGLARFDDGWRIDAVTMTATWATGNQQIMTLATQAAP